MRGTILIVDDDPEMCDLLRTGLRMRGFDTEERHTGDSALQALAGGDFDLVVTDLRMRGMNGLELCERIVADRPDVPVVVITAFGSIETAIEAIRAGAYDYIVKPLSVDALALTIERGIQHRRLHDEVTRLRRTVSEASHFEGLIGTSAPMRELYDLLGRIADSGASVLISGETGTGKELVARSLHQRSARKDGPFIAINCAAMPEPLLESELFGHARGAFTDARSEHTGLLVRADGGTLFLDEIADMPVLLQPKLLRALQERVVRPVGGAREIPFDARIVAATNRDVEAAVEDGRFRADLYFRLHVISVEVPPLRARRGDVLLLAQHFLDQYAVRAGTDVTGISPAAARKLLAYDWPGNVRELQNCIEHGVTLARARELAVEDLPAKLHGPRSWHGLSLDEPEELLPMHEVERRYIAHVLAKVDGNKRRAARILGFDRATLYRKLARYKIERARE